MLRVTESQTKSDGCSRRARVRLLIVARLARGEVAAIRLGVRRVTGVTLIVPGQFGRNG